MNIYKVAYHPLHVLGCPFAIQSAQSQAPFQKLLLYPRVDRCGWLNPLPLLEFAYEDTNVIEFGIEKFLAQLMYDVNSS